MKFVNVKTLLSVGVLSVVGLVGMSQEVSAQGNSGWAHEKNRIKKEQKQELKQARQQYRVYRNGGNGYYQTDQRGAELLRNAVNAGYQQGYQQGQMDRRNRRNGGYYGSNVYRSGNYGYQSYVDRSQYQYYFQQGFQRGYQDGYNSQTRYGSRSGNGINILGSILGSILNIREF
jgi:flagellar biosynthesis/type III secretory pathway protein FliH